MTRKPSCFYGPFTLSVHPVHRPGCLVPVPHNDAILNMSTLEAAVWSPYTLEWHIIPVGIPTMPRPSLSSVGVIMAVQGQLIQSEFWAQLVATCEQLIKGLHLSMIATQTGISPWWFRSRNQWDIGYQHTKLNSSNFASKKSKFWSPAVISALP